MPDLDARDLLIALLYNRTPPAWVASDLTELSFNERQAAVSRLVSWLTTNVVGKPNPEYEPDYDGRTLTEQQVQEKIQAKYASYGIQD